MSDCNDINNKNDCELHGFQRNHYFYSQLLTVKDFETEQDYLNGKRNLLNRSIHKPGIVCGFGTEKDINIESDGEGNRTIEFQKAGVALDGCGHEIIVPQGSKKKITGIEEVIGEDKCANIPSGQHMYLYLEYKECLTGSAPAAAGTSCEEEQYCPNRVVEGYEVTASGTPPHNNDAPCPDFTGIDNIEDMKKWLHDQLTQKCAGEKDPKVFIAALEGDFKIDRDETIKYRSFVYNNQLLGNLIHCIADELSEFKVEPGTCECIYEKGPVAFEPNKSWAWTFENPFGRIPIIDVYEKLTAGKTKKVKPGQQFIFFLKKTQTREMAQLLDVTEEYIDKKARSLEKFHEQVSRKKEDSVVPLDKPLKTYFDEISKTFNIRLTGRLKRQLTTRVKGSELTYHQLINRVYFIEYEVEQDVLWRKISHELDIQVDEDQVKITNPKGRKEGVIKVVMMGQQSITKI